ncbi:hypothetical protein LCGC14_2320900 [marine sediment metagenome]|uniref:Uncharacterized protein n=1 Tax=marine sediment metagenome TaxID=412755 RepID=A0A0F9CHX2_9ZZZZ
MEEQFDCIAGLDQIHQLTRNVQLKAAEHDHLSKAVAAIRQRLVRCDELEMNGRPQDSETIASLRNETPEYQEA